MGRADYFMKWWAMIALELLCSDIVVPFYDCKCLFLLSDDDDGKCELDILKSFGYEFVLSQALQVCFAVLMVQWGFWVIGLRH